MGICTVFVYLTSHSTEQGGGTLFPLLQPALAVQPKARSAAVWCNCKRDGDLDVDLAHSAEPLMNLGCSDEKDPSTEADLSEALQDRSIPLKIGMNMWFTDLPHHPH